jgi:hypothetical protein
MLFAVKYSALRATFLVSRDAYIRPFCSPIRTNKSGAESTEESFKTSGFATMASTMPTVAGIAHSAISDGCTDAVNGGAVENGAEEESKREKERKDGLSQAMMACRGIGRAARCKVTA